MHIRPFTPSPPSPRIKSLTVLVPHVLGKKIRPSVIIWTERTGRSLGFRLRQQPLFEGLLLVVDVIMSGLALFVLETLIAESAFHWLLNTSDFLSGLLSLFSISS